MNVGDSTFVFLLGLVLFGPKRLPEICRKVVNVLGELQGAGAEIKRRIMDELLLSEEDETRKPLKLATRAIQSESSQQASEGVFRANQTARALTMERDSSESVLLAHHD